MVAVETWEGPMRWSRRLWILLGALLMTSGAAAAEPGRITGVGGVFVVSKDPKALAAWYRDVLGITLQPWGGALLPYDALGHPPVVVWSAFAANATEIAPSKRPFMLNFAVDDLDAFIRRLEAKGVKVQGLQGDATGRFAWVLDPDGTKIELWQPPPK